MLRKEIVRRALSLAECVSIDFDCTLTHLESIDELASHLKKDVSAITHQVMNGDILYYDAMKMRLDVMRPSRQDIDEFHEKFKGTNFLAPGAKEFVRDLHEKRKRVFIVSGGLTDLILPHAKALGIPEECVIANKLLFHPDGSFAGFDESCPTCRNGGKRVALESLKKVHGFERVVHIGDGQADLETKPEAEFVIGYGGSVVRPLVEREADYFCFSFDELL